MGVGVAVDVAVGVGGGLAVSVGVTSGDGDVKLAAAAVAVNSDAAVPAEVVGADPSGVGDSGSSTEAAAVEAAGSAAVGIPEDAATGVTGLGLDGSVVCDSAAEVDVEPPSSPGLEVPIWTVAEAGAATAVSAPGVLPGIGVTGPAGVRTVCGLLQRSIHTKEADRIQMVKRATTIPMRDQATALNQAGRRFFTVGLS